MASPYKLGDPGKPADRMAGPQQPVPKQAAWRPQIDQCQAQLFGQQTLWPPATAGQKPFRTGR